LLTHRQTDRQTKSGKNITSLAEVTRSPAVARIAIRTSCQWQSRSSKVNDFHLIWQGVYQFLLTITHISNLGPILRRLATVHQLDRYWDTTQKYFTTWLHYKFCSSACAVEAAISQTKKRSKSKISMTVLRDRNNQYANFQFKKSKIKIT